MWKEREQIATNLHNLGISWGAAWVAADAELAKRVGEIPAFVPPQHGGVAAAAEETEANQVYYYIRTVDGDDVTAEAVTDPRRIIGAARIALLVRKIRSAVPGASVTIGLPGVGNGVMDFLARHLHDECEVVSEYGDREGETFVPSALAGVRQLSLIADREAMPGTIEAIAKSEEGNNDAEREYQRD